MSALDEATFGTAKLVFDDTEAGFQSRTDTGATYLCAARRYRPPQALVDIATADGAGRRRASATASSSTAPTPVTDDPEAPFGYDFDDPANLTFWWSQGAVGMWQVAEISLAEAEEHRLFEAPSFAQIKALADLNGGDPDRIKAWEQAEPRHRELRPPARGQHLRLAGRRGVPGHGASTTASGRCATRSTPGRRTIDDDALVFTTHPGPDLARVDRLGRDDGEPGYWTGEASMPRSAQFERTAVHIYQPAWDESTDALLWSVFGYRPFTHAYVPQDRFDEVVQQRPLDGRPQGRGLHRPVVVAGADVADLRPGAPRHRRDDPAVRPRRRGRARQRVGRRGGRRADRRRSTSWVDAVTASAPDGRAGRRRVHGARGRRRRPATIALRLDRPVHRRRARSSRSPTSPATSRRSGTVDRLATRYALRTDGARLDPRLRPGDARGRLNQTGTVRPVRLLERPPRAARRC